MIGYFRFHLQLKINVSCFFCVISCGFVVPVFK